MHAACHNEDASRITSTHRRRWSGSRCRTGTRCWRWPVRSAEISGLGLPRRRRHHRRPSTDPLLLELNARPDWSIQIANNDGLDSPACAAPEAVPRVEADRHGASACTSPRDLLLSRAVSVAVAARAVAEPRRAGRHAVALGWSRSPIRITGGTGARHDGALGPARRYRDADRWATSRSRRAVSKHRSCTTVQSPTCCSRGKLKGARRVAVRYTCTGARQPAAVPRRSAAAGAAASIS